MPPVVSRHMETAPCYPEKAPKVDRILDTLSSSLRREIIHYFENDSHGMTTTVEELVAHLDEQVPDYDREELATVLLHNHLPKLQSREWLEFERRSESIRYYGHDSAEQLLREVAEVFTE